MLTAVIHIIPRTGQNYPICRHCDKIDTRQLNVYFSSVQSR